MTQVKVCNNYAMTQVKVCNIAMTQVKVCNITMTQVKVCNNAMTQVKETQLTGITRVGSSYRTRENGLYPSV